MTEMTMKEALELAIDYMQQQYNPPSVGNANELRIAAEMLRNGGPVVKKSERTRYYNDDCQFVPFTKTWTERERLKIVTEESETTFEEIK